MTRLVRVSPAAVADLDVSSGATFDCLQRFNTRYILSYRPPNAYYRVEYITDQQCTPPPSRV